MKKLSLILLLATAMTAGSITSILAQITVTPTKPRVYNDIQTLVKNYIRIEYDGEAVTAKWGNVDYLGYENRYLQIKGTIPPVVGIDKSTYYKDEVAGWGSYYSSVDLMFFSTEYWAFVDKDLYKREVINVKVSINPAFLTDEMVEQLKRGAEIEGFMTYTEFKNVDGVWQLNIEIVVERIGSLVVNRNPSY